MVRLQRPTFRGNEVAGETEIVDKKQFLRLMASLPRWPSYIKGARWRMSRILTLFAGTNANCVGKWVGDYFGFLKFDRCARQRAPAFATGSPGRHTGGVPFVRVSVQSRTNSPLLSSSAWALSGLSCNLHSRHCDVQRPRHRENHSVHRERNSGDRRTVREPGSPFALILESAAKRGVASGHSASAPECD